MVRFKWLLVIILLKFPSDSFTQIELINDHDNTTAIAAAASEVLQKTVNEFLRATIVVLANNCEMFDSFINEIMQSASGNVIFTVINNPEPCNMSSDDDEYLNNCKKLCSGTCLYLVESLAVYEGNFVDLYNYEEGNIYVHYIHGASQSEVREVIDKKTLLMKFHPQSYLIFDGEYFIDLVTIEFYTPNACHQLQMDVINQLDKQNLIWQKPSTNFKQIRSFHHCSLFIEIEHEMENTKAKGFYVDLFKESEKFSDFMIHNDSFNEFNKSHSEAFKGYFMRHRIKIEAMSVKRIGHQVLVIPKELFFIIPPGELYSEWEILLLAFDATTWYLIITTFGASFSVILLIKLFASLKLRRYVYGNNVSTPTLNILIAFFGLSQVVSPERNFARFLLLAFITWSLIIRTCYLGLLYEYLQGEGRKPEIKTIDEMLDRNFTYFMTNEHFEIVKEMDFMAR